jgi:hypothetical protein
MWRFAPEPVAHTRALCTLCQRMTLSPQQIQPVAAGARVVLLAEEKTCSECDFAVGRWALDSPGAAVSSVWRLKEGERPTEPTASQLRRARDDNPIPFEQRAMVGLSDPLREQHGYAILPVDMLRLLQRGMNTEALFVAASFLVGYRHGNAVIATPALARSVVYDARLMKDGAVPILRQALRPA